MIDDPLWGKIEYVNVEVFEKLLKEILNTNVTVCCERCKYWHLISQWCDVKGCEKNENENCVYWEKKEE